MISGDYRISMIKEIFEKSRESSNQENHGSDTRKHDE
jgi:hypothetical protein